MYTRSPKYIAILIVPAIVVITACGNHDPASPTAPAAVTSALVIAEPMTATPEFSSSISFCPAAPSFGVRLLITISGNGDIVIVQRLRFAFADRFGGFAVPVVTQTPRSTSGAIPNSMPVPLPTSMPIPIPGSLPAEELVIHAGVSHTMPVSLGFGCGVPADGTIVVSVDTTDMRGRASTSQVRVRVGG